MQNMFSRYGLKIFSFRGRARSDVEWISEKEIISKARDVTAQASSVWKNSKSLTTPGDRRVCGSRHYEIVCVSVTTAHLNVIFRFMAAHSAIAFVEKFKCLVKLTLLIIFYTIARSIIGEPQGE